MKTLKTNYYAPTPAKWRKLGDALLGASMTITTFSVYSYPAVAITACVIGTVGKFITNFFTEDGQN